MRKAGKDRYNFSGFSSWCINRSWVLDYFFLNTKIKKKNFNQIQSFGKIYTKITYSLWNFFVTKKKNLFFLFHFSESWINFASLGNVHFTFVWIYIWTDFGYNRSALGLWRLANRRNERTVNFLLHFYYHY